LSSAWYTENLIDYFFLFKILSNISVDGDRIVFVGRDGVQYPPFHIKDKGGHLLAFLTCLESGLAPHGQLDPPLGYEKGLGKLNRKMIC
jgi:hypothetical protein